MSDTPLITLLTDFGLRDPCVAAMKGVIAGISPQARVVDISHGVEPQNIRQGGLIWAQAVPFFPPGTVHVAVVDPGVGSSRSIVAVRGRGGLFLAPDNGIVGFVLKREEIVEAVVLQDSRYFLPEVSSTFHGRDILAPVAAHLAGGVELGRLGPPAESIELTPFPEATRSFRKSGELELDGEILEFDHFGNGVTNIRLQNSDRVVDVRIGRHRFSRLCGCYEEVPRGEGLVLIGSSGLLEVSVREGRADRVLDLRRSQPVTVIVAPPGRGEPE